MCHPGNQSQTRSRSRRLSLQRNPDAVVTSARAVRDPFNELHLPSIVPTASPSTFELLYATGPELAGEEINWMIDSIESSLRDFYESSQMAWNRQEKFGDLCHLHQRFLFVSQKEIGRRVAFLSFRWDIEENEPIMYVYELFVEPCARGNRIAMALMTYAEDFCRALKVGKLMLTVFCQNQAAMRLYRDRLGYEIDDDSPSKYGIKNVGYEILSKILPKVDES